MIGKNNSAVTLIELMITLAIIAIVMSIAVITMSGYIPKQRLISTQAQLVDLLQRAQTEANARSFWTCVLFTNNSAQVYVDINGNHTTGVSTACGDTANGDIALQGITYKDGISLGSSSAGCTNNIASGCVLWFDTTGSPKLCAGTHTNCGAAAAGSGLTLNCIDWSYQIVVSQAKLASGARAREVEALQGGLVQIVKPMESGLVTSYTLSAMSAANTSGCE